MLPVPGFMYAYAWLLKNSVAKEKIAPIPNCLVLSKRVASLIINLLMAKQISRFFAVLSNYAIIQQFTCNGYAKFGGLRYSLDFKRLPLLFGSSATLNNVWILLQKTKKRRE